MFEPDKEMVADYYSKGLISFPYWSQVWPSAIALARFLMQHSHFMQHKQVLELAAGLGLPAVVAARYASSVVASDYAPEAVAAMQQTVAYNLLQNVQVQLLDWTHLPADLTADVLLLSDVSYDASLFAIQEKVVRAFLKRKTTVIISTPQRLIAKEAIAPLLPFCVHQEEVTVLHYAKEVAITVMVLRHH